MIYTTYLSNLKNIPENSIKILITRWRPRNTINKEKYGLLWRPNLAPSELTLSQRKDGNLNWQQFRKQYIQESYDNQLFIDGLNEIMDYDDAGKDVFLICYEKDELECHRIILKEILILNNYNCKEYRKDF